MTHTARTFDYAAACRQAAADQGLDPLTDGLAVAGVPFRVDQTGGYCMAVVLPADGGTLVAIHDADPDSDEGYASAWYPGDAWENGDEVTDERVTNLAGCIARFESVCPAEHTCHTEGAANLTPAQATDLCPRCQWLRNH